MLRPNVIWMYDNSATEYVDLTSNIYTSTAFDFIEDVNDIIYIGCDRRFTGVYAELSQNGSYTSLTYKYLDGDSNWSYLPLIDSYSFSESKYCRWNLKSNWASMQFSTTFPHTVSSVPEDNEYYWIKLSASAVTTKAIISEIRLMPYAAYTTSDKVSEFLGLKKPYDESTTPTDLQVEDLIRRQEDYIDYRTKKSWKLKPITEDTEMMQVDYNRYGVFLRNRNFYKVYSVKLWNGNSWETLTEGRTSDYFVNYDLGVIYFTRLFMLPACYGMTGRYYQWGMGEFKNSIKVDYIYGRNPETDPEFFIAEDVATKLVARDLLQHSDYTALIVSGTDKVPLESKIRLLTDDIELKLDSLTGICLY